MSCMHMFLLVFFFFSEDRKIYGYRNWWLKIVVYYSKMCLMKGIPSKTDAGYDCSTKS